MSEEQREANTLKKDSYAEGGGFVPDRIRIEPGQGYPLFGFSEIISTAVSTKKLEASMETIEALLTQQNDLLTQVHAQLASLRVDLWPMAKYFKSITDAAQDQEAEAAHLPIGFPAAAKLEEAGITAVADVPRKSSALRRLGLDGDEVTAVLMEISNESAPL